jgi:2-keto-3-deoxy-L-rhamnonate aldolase RhmA
MTKTPPSANTWLNPHVVQNAASETLRDSLLRGEKLRAKALSSCAIGTFLIELPTPSILPALSLAGFDFVVLDMEHSAIDFVALQALITAAHAAGIAALVRPYSEDPGLIGKILDMGANGIMASHVDTPERARAVVEQARFPPRGTRSFSPLMKFDPLEHPLQALGDAAYVIVQIEGRAALERVNDIASVPGVDALFVGPYDLALSLDVPPGSPQVRTMAQRATSSVPKTMSLGIYIDDPEQCGVWAEHGFTLQCVSFDGRMIASGARAVVSQAQHALSKARTVKRGGESVE